MIIALLLLCTAHPDSEACTSFIACGKATPDGRPLMWKNRDSSTKENMMQHFPAKDGFFAFTAVVNSGVKNPYDVWTGTNSRGFSIMNTQSYNIVPAADKNKGDENGKLMRMALERCATVEDFAHFLDTLRRPIPAAANFGAIDAEGGAAYFETNRTGYFRFDATDPAVAPDGYLVRTNFSFEGRPREEGHGQVRYDECAARVAEAVGAGALTPEFVLGNLSRSYANPLLGTDYLRKGWASEWAVEQDIITRFTTVSSIIVQGVKPGESPALTTMWSVIGYPGTTVAMPVWECAGQKGIPEMLRPDSSRRSPLSHWGYLLKMRSYCYSAEQSNARKYFNWKVMEENVRRVMSFESRLLEPYRRALEGWRKDGKVDIRTLAVLNGKADEAVRDHYEKLFLPSEK